MKINLVLMILIFSFISCGTKTTTKDLTVERQQHLNEQYPKTVMIETDEIITATNRTSFKDYDEVKVLEPNKTSKKTKGNFDCTLEGFGKSDYFEIKKNKKCILSFDFNFDKNTYGVLNNDVCEYETSQLETKRISIYFYRVNLKFKIISEKNQTKVQLTCLFER